MKIMVLSIITVKFIVFIMGLLQTTSCAQDRTLISQINPGCNTCEGNATLLYVQAIGKRDTIHEIWDFTRGSPTFIFVVAGLNSSMEFSWDGCKPQKFILPDQTQYSFSTAIDQLYEYNDLADVGRYDWHMPQTARTLSDVTWRLKNSTLTGKQATLMMEGTLPDDDTGIVSVKLNLLPYKDSADQLPHLIHTANSTQVDIGLVNLTTSHRYNSSRFAVHWLIASTDSSKDTMQIMLRKSLDDEHTPGVFEMIEIKTPRAFTNGNGGFIQFRPVAYTQSERGVASSTMVYMTELEKSSLPVNSTLSVFYNDIDLNCLLVEGGFISFGEPGDGFYKQHNYTAWSFSIGYGTPPTETFSPFVILVIILGLSLPVLLAISGILYVIIIRFDQRRGTRRLTEED